jgi:hypothetical protein
MSSVEIRPPDDSVVKTADNILLKTGVCGKSFAMSLAATK